MIHAELIYLFYLLKSYFITKDLITQNFKLYSQIWVWVSKLKLWDNLKFNFSFLIKIILMVGLGDPELYLSYAAIPLNNSGFPMMYCCYDWSGLKFCLMDGKKKKKKILNSLNSGALLELLTLSMLYKPKSPTWVSHIDLQYVIKHA